MYLVHYKKRVDRRLALKEEDVLESYIPKFYTMLTSFSVFHYLIPFILSYFIILYHLSDLAIGS